jgi:AraC-like DNA-binding protein
MAVYQDNASALGYHPELEYHPETEIVWVNAGHVELQVDGTTYSYREGDIFVIPGNALHLYQSVSPDVKYMSLIFSPDVVGLQPLHFFQKAFTAPLKEGRLQLPRVLRPDHPAYKVVREQLELIQSTRIYDKDYKLRRFGAFMAICVALLPYCTEVEGDRTNQEMGNEAVRQCMRYIHNHYTKKLTLEQLARVCHLHPNYLCALFKEYTGQTVFQYLTRFRVESATLLLKHRELPVGKVGEMVGFHSESLFFRKFKEIMGMTPKDYAKEQKQK